MEVTVTQGTIFGEKELKKLLANKDKLVAQDAGDGRNQYQVEIQKLKDKFKAENAKAKKQGFKNIKFKFGDTLKHVKKQEREGKFDRGAEGKTKKNLRAKMAKEPEKIYTSGRHKGSDADIAIEETGIKDVSSDSKANISRDLAGQKIKKKKKSVAKSR